MFQTIKIAVLLFVTMGIMLTSGNYIHKGPVDEGQTDRSVHVQQNPDESQTD
jgi:hypothetical protein